MAKAVWVDAGNDPDYAKLQANGITVPYFDLRDPRVTAAYLDAVKATSPRTHRSASHAYQDSRT